MKHPLKLVAIRHDAEGNWLSPDRATEVSYEKIMGRPAENFPEGSIAAQQYLYSNMKRKQLSIEELCRG